jgi:hypothetical protein
LEESKLSPFLRLYSPFFYFSVKLIDCRSEKGGANKRAPENWTTSLATVFQSKYLGTITTYYPYSPVSNTTSPSPSINTVPSPSSIVPSPSNPGGGSKIPTWLCAVIGVILGVVIMPFLVVWCFCRRRFKRKCIGMVPEADSRFVYESGGGQVYELGEYQGYNRLALLVVLHAFLIIFAFTDSSRLVELPTNNSSRPPPSIAARKGGEAKRHKGGVWMQNLL